MKPWCGWARKGWPRFGNNLSHRRLRWRAFGVFAFLSACVSPSLMPLLSDNYLAAEKKASSGLKTSNQRSSESELSAYPIGVRHKAPQLTLPNVFPPCLSVTFFSLDLLEIQNRGPRTHVGCPRNIFLWMVGHNGLHAWFGGTLALVPGIAWKAPRDFLLWPTWRPPIGERLCRLRF